MKSFLDIDFEKSVGPWLGRTVKLVDYHIHEAFKLHGLDLTKEQMIILKKLYEEDGLNQNELALLTYRDKSSLARLLAKMEAKDYLKRKQQIEDRRVNEVFLTDKGAKLFERTRPIIKKMIQTMEKDITEVEKDVMIKLLKKIQFNFNSENTKPLPNTL